MKMKKKVIFSTIVLGSIIGSASLGALFYYKTPDRLNSINGFERPSKPYVATGQDFATNSNSISHTDSEKLKQNERPKTNVDILPPPPVIKKDEIKKEEPKTDENIPKVEVDKKKEDKKEEPKNNTIVIENKDLEDKQEKPKTEKVIIKKGDIEFEATITEVPPRKYDKSDKENGITNRVPYYAEIVPDATTSSGATENNIRVSVSRAIENAKLNNWATKPGTSYEEILVDENRSITVKQNYFNNIGSAPEILGNLWARFYLLLGNKELLRSYQDEVGLRNFDKWYNNTEEKLSWKEGWNTRTVPLNHLLLLMHIDYSKITKLAKSEIEALNRGETIPKDGANLSVNEKGEWISHNHEPIYNAVTAEYTRNNQDKRVLGNNSHWNRFPDDIEKGNYANWKKTRITSTFASKPGYGYISNGGIQIDSYTREENVNNHSLDKATIITIDMENSNGYNNAKRLIEQLIRDNVPITGYRFWNIGRTGADQNVYDIMKVLPKKIPLLELFFESKNTSALNALRDKEIDELGLYSNNKVGLGGDDWSFNPWALKGVAWVNTQDYASGLNYASHLKVYGRITFENLAFDKEDYLVKDDFTNINLGLRMAYWTRNNEKIFQGPWGAGLKPDRNESGSGYPMGLDFSRLPEIKSLRGMIFYDKNKPSNMRKLNKIKFYNDSNTFTMPILDVNEAQLNTVFIRQSAFPRSKIMFSNGKQTNKLKITAKANENITATGLTNLGILMAYSDGNFNKTTTEVIVPKEAQTLYQTLKSNGYNVKYESSFNLDGYIIN